MCNATISKSSHNVLVTGELRFIFLGPLTTTLNKILVSLTTCIAKFKSKLLFFLLQKALYSFHVTLVKYHFYTVTFSVTFVPGAAMFHSRVNLQPLECSLPLDPRYPLHVSF